MNGKWPICGWKEPYGWFGRRFLVEQYIYIELTILEYKCIDTFQLVSRITPNLLCPKPFGFLLGRKWLFVSGILLTWLNVSKLLIPLTYPISTITSLRSNNKNITQISGMRNVGLLVMTCYHSSSVGCKTPCHGGLMVFTYVICSWSITFEEFLLTLVMYDAYHVFAEV